MKSVALADLASPDGVGHGALKTLHIRDAPRQDGPTLCNPPRKLSAVSCPKYGGKTFGLANSDFRGILGVQSWQNVQNGLSRDTLLKSA